MNNISVRVAYLRGLTEGLDIKETSKENKLLLAIVDLLEDLVDEITLMQDSQEELEEYMEAVDEDLSELEEEVYDSIDDDEYEEEIEYYDEELEDE